ncbi:MAG: hypothetical protein JWO80_690 [Bryobacterales bacterium]|nr:hypothetical protein [Bryobacterales bacterium]
MEVMGKRKKSNLLHFPPRPAPPTDSVNYEALLRDLIEEHRPANTVEHALVEMMARQYCLIQRSLILQQDAFDHGEVVEKLPLLMRQHSAAERGFHKALAALMDLRKVRRK